MDFEEGKEIRNSKIVIDYFGYWPTFHDSEIISIKFERTWDKESSSMQIRVYAFEMTDKLKGKYFELVKHCVIDFEFTGIKRNEMDGFNHQNAIQGLDFGREGEFLFCKIDPAYGVEAFILAREIIVKRLEPITT